MINLVLFLYHTMPYHTIPYHTIPYHAQTAKSMAELEIELNEKVRGEYDRIQESGTKLKPLYGPGLTGLENLGNSYVCMYVCMYICQLMQLTQVLHEFYPSSALFSQ